MSYQEWAIACVVLLLMLFLAVRYWHIRNLKSCTHEAEGGQTQLVHRLCPHQNVVQSFQVDQKDSLDEHLDVLTRTLAEKEGRMRISKSKIMQTQHELENLHAIDDSVREHYLEIMESLHQDLLNNEMECKKVQEQIEWMSRRRAELKEEVRRGQRMYGEAAAELANNLTELQRGRIWVPKVTDKPQKQLSSTSLRRRREPHLPKAEPVGSLVIKSPPASLYEVPSTIRAADF